MLLAPPTISRILISIAAWRAFYMLILIDFLLVVQLFCALLSYERHVQKQNESRILV
jgi:hypothetical protein